MIRDTYYIACPSATLIDYSYNTTQNFIINGTTHQKCNTIYKTVRASVCCDALMRFFGKKRGRVNP